MSESQPLLQSPKQPAQSRLLGLLILLALVTACTSNPLTPLASAPRTIEPARAADSPRPSQNPAGAVRPLAGHPLAAVFDSGTRQLAVLCPGSEPSESASVAVFGSGPVPPRVIDLRARASAQNAVMRNRFHGVLGAGRHIAA